MTTTNQTQPGACTSLDQDKLNEAMLAAVCKNDAAEVWRLVAIGADVNCETKYRQRALHEARSSEIAELLIESGANLIACTDFDITALHKAAQHGRADVAAVLIAALQAQGLGGGVDAIDLDGDTPLHWALMENNDAVAIVLLDANACMSAPGTLENTPLHTAAAHGNISMAQLLLRKGSDIEARNCDGNTPLDLATEHAQGGMTRLLLGAGAVNNACKDL